MTPQEKDLIDSVFDRLAKAEGAPKDAEALALIRNRAATLPDSLYGLVQAVLVQEMTLNQAQAHVADLERKLAQAQASGGAAPAPSTGFLGGGAASPWGHGSVPRSGAPAPQQYAPPPGAGFQGAGFQAAPQPAPQYAQPQYVPPQYAAPPAGGSFLHNAASMAAGVAGGALLAEGISSMFGGHHTFGGYGGGFSGGFGGAGFGGNPWGGSPGNVENVQVNNYYEGSAPGGGTRDTDFSDQGAQDPTFQDASFDDNSVDTGSSFDSDGGGFDDSGSTDI